MRDSGMTTPTPFASLDAEALYATLRNAVARLLAGLPAENTHLLGIYSGGGWIAERLQKDLGLAGEPGFLNISFYRDDYEKIGLHSEVRPTSVPFDVQDKHLIVLDDVLYTGRTIRGAMNELFDYGRPASIKLAVLVDRGGRELPVAADIAALTVALDPQQTLVLSQHEGRFHFEFESQSPEPDHA